MQSPAILPDGWRALPFEPFRAGGEVHCRWQTGSGPVGALLQNSPEAYVPRHRHPGLETIIVLDVVQSDENGDYGPGSMILNPVGSTHRVWSEQGCTVLIQWERPVEFRPDDRVTLRAANPCRIRPASIFRGAL